MMSRPCSVKGVALRSRHGWWCAVGTMLLPFLLVCAAPSGAAALGAFELTASDSAAHIRLQLASQLQTVWESRDGGDDNDRESFLVMKIRRVRPVLRVTVPDYRTSLRLHLNLSPGSSELMDLQFDSRLSENLRVRVGQFKIPFTRYRIQSFQRLTFVDWSLVTKYFGAERQLGLALHNGYEQPGSIAYAIGVFNGTNARASHAVQLARLYGEEVVNRSDLSESSSRAEFHPEVVCHIAFGSPGMAVRSDSDADQGDLRYHVASSVAWDLDPDIYHDLALRVAQEVLLKYRGASFMAAGYVGCVEMHSSLRTREAFMGLLVQSSYRVSDRVELSARYARVDIDSHLADAAYLRAQSLIADGEEAAVSRYKNAGMLLAEHEGTFGVNIYLKNHNLKLQNDIGLTGYDRRDGDLTDVTVRSQIQLAF